MAEPRWRPPYFYTMRTDVAELENYPSPEGVAEAAVAAAAAGLTPRIESTRWPPEFEIIVVDAESTVETVIELIRENDSLLEDDGGTT